MPAKSPKPPDVEVTETATETEETGFAVHCPALDVNPLFVPHKQAKTSTQAKNIWLESISGFSGRAEDLKVTETSRLVPVEKA